MRLCNFKSLAILTTGLFLAAGMLLQTVDATPEHNSRGSQHDGTPDIVLQAMSWWYFNSRVSRAELMSNLAAHSAIIDLRQPEDFTRGHLPGAVNIPADQLVAQLGAVAPDHDQSILLYGYDETHSVRSLATLRLLAYTHVMHLKGGWTGNEVAPNSNTSA